MERIIGCIIKLVDLWMKYRDPIDLLDRPSNMEIGLFGYQKGTNNKWTYNLTDHLMVFIFQMH